MKAYVYLKLDCDEKIKGEQRALVDKFIEENIIDVEKIVEETVSGSVKAENRPKLQELINRMEKGDILIITGFIRLGRYNKDSLKTWDKLRSRNIKLCILDKPFFNDWTLIQNNKLYNIISDLLYQEETEISYIKHLMHHGSTLTGMRKAVASGKKIGRPAMTLPPKEFCENYEQYKNGSLMGLSLTQFCRYCGISKSGYYKWVRLIEAHEILEAEKAE